MALEQKIKESWDETYKSHDYKCLPWETTEPDKELVRILEERNVEKGKALDVGCGAGTNSIFLAKQGFQVTGIDISPSAITIARQRAKEADVKVVFLVANAYSLDFPKGSFDFIFDRGCFHHIPPAKREKYIKQNHRLLTSKGVYYLHAFSDSNNWQQENLFSSERIKSYFGGYFEVREGREVVHIQPNDGKVYLRSVLMQKT